MTNGIRLFQSLRDFSLREKRVTLKLHDRWNKTWRHAFRLKDGTVYEGYFDAIQQDRVIFSPASGVWSSQDDLWKTIEILIEDIELIIFSSDVGVQSGPVWDFLARTSQAEEPAHQVEKSAPAMNRKRWPFWR